MTGNKSGQSSALILGIGNTIYGDDAIGIYLARALQEQGQFPAEFRITEEMGLGLLEKLCGYKQLIVIDSILTPDNNIGKVHHYKGEDFISLTHFSCHYAGLPELFHIARLLQLDFPQQIHILGIEISDATTVSDTLSPALRRKFPGILANVHQILEKVLQPGTIYQKNN